MELDNKSVHDNNCWLRCVKIFLNIEMTYAEIRRKFKLKPNTKINVVDLMNIYNTLKNPADKPLKIIDSDYKGYIDVNKKNYIFYKKNHYTALLKQPEARM